MIFKNLAKSFVLFVLKTIASIQLKKYRAEIVGVTGSVGKTGLVEACALVLKTRFKLLKLKEGYNSEIGIPLAILDQETGFSSPTAWSKILLSCFWKVISDWRKYDIVLLEMGVDKPNDMKYLTSFIKPFASIFLNIAAVHTGNFSIDPELVEGPDSKDVVKDVFEEKAVLIGKTKPEGFTVLNADDPMIKTLEGTVKARTMWVGSKVSRESHLRGVNLKTPRELEGNIAFHDVSVNSKGLSFEIKVKRHSEARGRRIPRGSFATCPQRYLPEAAASLRAGAQRCKRDTQDDSEVVKEYSVFVPNIFGKEYAYTFSAAIALGLGFGIPPEESIEALKEFKLPPGRLNVLKGIKDTILIDGSYNASRLSVIQTLNVLKLYKKRKKIAVLGDMRELGEYAKQEHMAVAREAVKVADELVLLGPLMKKYFYPEATKLGFDKNKIYIFQKAGGGLEFLKKHLKGKEVILLKGSQNTIFLEIVVEGLLANKADSHLLCRRGPEWNRLREPYM